MDCAKLWRASLLMIALAAVACGQEKTLTPRQQSTLASREDSLSRNKALILDTTVTGGALSAEALAASQAGLTPYVVPPSQWATMTAEEFATYRVIILGDASCANLDAVSAAVANRHVWGPVVNGNIFIAGTAPVANLASPLVTQKAIRFASQQSGNTGLYVSLGCYYKEAAPNTHVELLEPFGDFTVQGGSCHSETHIVSTDPDLAAISDELLSGWPCSVATQFNSFPQSNFAPFSIAMYTPGSRTGSQGGRDFADGTFGAPYILARGTVLAGCGNYEEDVGEACDLGWESNGIAGVECSSTCQFNWCGDGVVDPGETCDDGEYNGAGAGFCPRSCRVLPPPPPSRRPPLAICRHLTLSAGPTCGGVGANIDNGSSDPDGDLVGCVQSATTFETGLTSVSLTCTDAVGLTASCTGSVTVVDDSAPTISCPAASTFECGAGTAQLTPATAQDNCTSPTVSYSMEGDAYALGSARQVTWKASDGTNQATCTTSVTMVDTQGPSLALKGEASVAVECGVGQYTEAGALASDVCSGDLSAKVAISGTVDPAARGSYTKTYSVADAAGNVASATRTVSVNDTLAPALSLVGAAAMQLECGVDSFTNPGATAVDACAGNLTGAIVKTGAVDAAKVGTYTLGYSVVDAAGNAASAARAVSVADTRAPSLSLVGAASMKLECGVDSFTNPGATAADACAGDLTASIVSTGSVNTAAPGSYPVSYKVQDASGNSASATRAVQVADTQAPSLTLNGASALSLECGVGAYTEAGAKASDVCSGDLSNQVTISGTVNAAARGSYTKTYSVVDPAGNAASATRSVNVSDTLAPALSLLGAASMKLECGVDSFTNPGATAVDACAGNLTAAIVSSGAVDTAKVGSYPVSYSVADAAGNAASAVRAVQVADTQAPSLALKGSATMTLECGVGTYTEAGATATDACTGDLSNQVTISGTVNTAARGSYTKTYSVADASGNAASAVVRTVSVTDTKAPTVSLVGAATMTINRGSSFVDPGATAADACFGNLTSAIVKTGSVNTSVAGTYTLRYTVTDGAGLSSFVTRTVTVQDSCNTVVTVKPMQQIWPPNHSYRSFRLSDCAAVTSNCGSGGGCHGGGADINDMGTILSIYSDEVEDANGNGDGSTLNDIVITGPSSFKVRAERQGKGNGRVYGIRFKVTDTSGAVQTATCKLAVPHDQGDTNVVDNGAAAGYTVNASF